MSLCLYLCVLHVQAEQQALQAERTSLHASISALQAALAQAAEAAAQAAQGSVSPRTHEAERRRVQALSSEVLTLK